jgi:hypothetical protein
MVDCGVTPLGSVLDEPCNILHNALVKYFCHRLCTCCAVKTRITFAVTVGVTAQFSRVLRIYGAHAWLLVHMYLLAGNLTCRCALRRGVPHKAAIGLHRAERSTFVTRIASQQPVENIDVALGSVQYSAGQTYPGRPLQGQHTQPLAGGSPSTIHPDCVALLVSAQIACLSIPAGTLLGSSGCSASPAVSVADPSPYCKCLKSQNKYGWYLSSLLRKVGERGLAGAVS